jgi:hypothetical protein
MTRDDDVFVERPLNAGLPVPAGQLSGDGPLNPVSTKDTWDVFIC